MNNRSCSRLVSYKGEKVEQFSFENEAAAREVEKDPARRCPGRIQRSQRHQTSAPSQPGRAIHDIDVATGSLSKTGFQHTAHHARRAEALRRNRVAGRRSGRPDLLHAYRLGHARRGRIAEIRDVIAERYGKKNVPEEPRTSRQNRRTRRKRTKLSARRPLRTSRMKFGVLWTTISTSCIR